MGCYVLGFEDIDQSKVAVVGGKGAALGELSRVEGVSVPPGFCVTTDAFRRVVEEAASLEDPLARLARLEPGERGAIGQLAAEIRGTLEGTVIPEDVTAAITAAVGRLGAQDAYAVRSSATAEDLPGASFAGQQDTYLNVVGRAAILEHVRRCWASLFTERAVIYRLRNGFDHRKVHMAVVVQQMVLARASGVLFTADPITANRRVAAVEATAGLGESLVSGLVNADVYRVRDGKVIAHEERQAQPPLTDAQAVRLAQLGRRVEAHFGHPQDIEWCLADDAFEIVQSRPITTLFPIPESGDEGNHVYVSVGHQQMMTDAMKPLGLSVWQLTTPRQMAEAGGRLFVDVAPILSSPRGRDGMLTALRRSDPLIGDALQTVIDRGDFIPTLADDGPDPLPRSVTLANDPPVPVHADPAVVADLIRRSEASLAALKDAIHDKTGPELLAFIIEDFAEMKKVLFDPESLRVIMAAMGASWWLNEQMEAWLGEKNAVDRLTQSVPHNVTSQMGLALLDVADVIRRNPEVVAFLQHVEDVGDDASEDFVDELPAVAGGEEARAAIHAYLDRYGMRCVGEIDITRPRWSERPRTLVPLILGNVRNFAPGAGAQRFEQGRQEAERTQAELLARLRALPEGEQKAEEARRRIDLVRTFMGYREFPKYGMISRYFVYKQALMGEADRLVQAGVLRDREDVFYLRLAELEEVTRTHEVDDQLLRERRDAFRSYEALTPPRVFTSEGEVITGTYRRDDLPAGALVGLPVSSGTIEGRARVILDMGDADLEPGDILVTAYTDPSWTPLFVTVTGLVTEVGGLMTHGAVIAREYGLPAVVGVEQATRLIRDGQRIRVHGLEGYVELLS